MHGWTSHDPQHASTLGTEWPRIRVSAPAAPLNGFDTEHRLLAKRSMDLALGLALLILVSPLALLIAIAIKIDSPGPVIYRHWRIGRHGRAFACLKFRTMVQDAEQRLPQLLASMGHACEWNDTRKLRRDPRITPIGHLLRATSLDELPQLINILCGDMSLVGPRPVTDRELDRYGLDAAWYLSFRPGLTGPWQISGRSRVTFETRVRLDTDYVRNWSLAKDAHVLARTPWAVLKRDGAY